MSNAQNPQTLASRKSDHLDLARAAQSDEGNPKGFGLDYEPLFGTHPKADGQLPETPFQFLGKTQRIPLWVSSMTGGTNEAAEINRRLARVCCQYGMGMGLGSCRSILESDEFFADFDLRRDLGHEVPFYANIGIAQLEELLVSGRTTLLSELTHALQADGLIIHLNPMQEWFQPEGDRFQVAPIEVLREFKKTFSLPIIVKEVGQGMGPRSLLALAQLQVAGIEFGAYGGTNFSKLEALRREQLPPHWEDLCGVGHSAEEMLTNLLQISKLQEIPALIISGGIRSVVQGYSLLSRAPEGSVLGLAMPILAQAREGEEALDQFVKSWAQGLAMAREFLAPREENR